MAFNIVTSSDNNYAQHACVMLTSLLIHHRFHSFRIFLLVPPCFSDENKAKILDSISPWSHAIEFVSVDDSKVINLRVDGHIRSAAYYRLYLGELIPLDVKTLLWLDADIVVIDSIIELLNLDISNFSLAAVPDAACDRNDGFRARKGLEHNTHYFNSGVMLLNLERWRSERIGERALELLRSKPDLVIYHDQCALNYVISGYFYVLDKKWNFQTDNMSRLSEFKFHKNAIKEADGAALIHFTTGHKPWQFSCSHPLRDLYFKYLEYTAWRDFVEEDRTPRKIIRKFLRHYLPSTARRVEAIYMFGKRLSLSRYMQ